MQTTSHYPMRSRTITSTERGCIRVARPGRPEARRRAIAESTGLR